MERSCALSLLLRYETGGHKLCIFVDSRCQIKGTYYMSGTLKELIALFLM